MLLYDLQIITEASVQKYGCRSWSEVRSRCRVNMNNVLRTVDV